MSLYLLLKTLHILSSTLLFGTGLVRTAEDFGSQGEPPSHPELLTKLSAEFVRGGYRFKNVIRLIANSRAYQLSPATQPSNTRSGLIRTLFRAVLVSDRPFV